MSSFVDQALVAALAAAVAGLATYVWLARARAVSERQIEGLTAQLQAAHAEAENLTQARDELARERKQLGDLSGLTPESAREMVLGQARQEAEFEAAKLAKSVFEAATDDAHARARDVILQAMERVHVELATESTVAIVPLPNEEMKGRIIGREGRNIRAFEQITGAELIIDDTPETAVVSCFDPVRRETARLTLMNLMVDGRIHPARIEEIHAAASAELGRTMSVAGADAAREAGVLGLPQPVIEQIGRLRFRSSYAQNVLAHSVEVAGLATILAHETGSNVECARVAGFLHDIGKGLGPEFEGPHALTGMEFLRRHGLGENVLHAVGAHHREIEPQTIEAHLVILADSLSATRPGARRENLEHYLKRMTKLETMAAECAGVDRAYAVQAGRELRVFVRPEQIDDAQANKLAKDLASRISSEAEIPGQVRVTVIRESRVTEVAR